MLFSKRNKKTAKLDKRNSTKHPKVLEGKLKLQKKLSARGSNVNTTKSCATTYTRNQKERKKSQEREQSRERAKKKRVQHRQSLGDDWRVRVGLGRFLLPLPLVVRSTTKNGGWYYLEVKPYAGLDRSRRVRRSPVLRGSIAPPSFFLFLFPLSPRTNERNRGQRVGNYQDKAKHMVRSGGRTKK